MDEKGDGCAHVRKFKAEGGMKTLTTLQRYTDALAAQSLAQQSQQQTPTTTTTTTTATPQQSPSQPQPRVVAPPRCTTCGTFLGRLCACLGCVHFACPAHLQSHLQSHLRVAGSSPAGGLALDLGSMHIYCAECGDYVYNAEWEASVRASKRRKFPSDGAEEDDPQSSCSQTPRPQQAGAALSAVVPGTPWQSAAATRESLEELMRNYVTAIAPHTVRTPVRGLRNLGNTCFMNSVLQCVIHNPMLRNWFLSDMHWRCPSKLPQQPQPLQSGDQVAAAAQTQSNGSACLACELHALFEELFDGDSAVVVPHRFLYTLWRLVGSLASYEQHDAHELLISVLNVLHTEVAGASSTGAAERSCQCIVHRTFGGLLRSDVTCARCHEASTTYDPLMDVSLDIPRSQDSTGEGSRDGELCTLATCLERFVRPETLAQSEQFHCSHCNCRCDGVKQLTLARLPNVLCIHLKRFEHAQLRRISSKVEARVDFPCTIDIGPYTAPPKGGKGRAAVAYYDLFGVVNHYGRLDTGHYTSFVRSGRVWFACDDANVTRVPISQVLKSQAYLLFYVKRKLDYEGASILSPPFGSQVKKQAGDQQPTPMSL